MLAANYGIASHNSDSLPALLDVKIAVLSRSLFRDSIGLSVVVDFVMVVV